LANTAVVDAPAVKDGWTKDNATVLAICAFGWMFDVYEQTILQIVTPILIREWGISPALMGSVTTIGRWVGLIGIFIFPVLADLYGRKPLLIISILGYSLFSGLTGFASGWISLLVLTSLNRIALSGELPVGMVMVAETAPTKWRASALTILNSGYPCGYMLCSFAAYFVVPLWGWQMLYWLGIIPALLVLWIRTGIKESPRFERVSATMLREGLKRRLDIWSPLRKYPRDILIASLVYFFYLFTLIGWSAWMPQFLAVEKKLGFQIAVKYLSIWMLVAISAYWICGWLSDKFGRRHLIPALAIPAAALIVAMAHLEDPTSLFWAGLCVNFLMLGSFGPGLGYTAELFPTQIRGTAVGASYTFGTAAGATAPAILGWIAGSHSIAAGLPLLALSFFLLAPLFLFFARDTTRKELTDFVGQQ
jgi:putative MFS transporter